MKRYVLKIAEKSYSVIRSGRPASIPSPSNLKVDFIPEGMNRYQNFSKLIEQIDLYLQEQNLDHFKDDE